MDRVRIGFWMRLVAALVDGLVAGVLIWVPTLLLGKIHPALGALVGGVLVMAYFCLEVLKAQTLGKMLFQYKITAQDGSPATCDQLVKRWGFKQVPNAIGVVAAVLMFITPALGFLVYVGMLAGLAIVAGTLLTLRPEKLAFHDQLFGTAVYGPAKLSISIPKLTDVLPATGTPTPATQTVKAA
jgi:uncharacterized RDD family membrane protein YckC